MGSLIEKGLLIAFAIFIFFLVVKIVTDIIDMVTNEVFNLSDFFLGTSCLIVSSLLNIK